MKNKHKLTAAIMGAVITYLQREQQISSEKLETNQQPPYPTNKSAK